MKLQHCLEIGAITFPRGNVEDVFPEVEGDKLAARKGNTEELGEPGHKEPAADTVSGSGSPQLRTKAVLQDHPASGGSNSWIGAQGWNVMLSVRVFSILSVDF